MDNAIFLTVQAAVCVVCWLVVAGGAGLAVFSPSIHDTVFERIGLSAVSITATGAAWRIIQAGWESDGDTTLALAMAGYVATVAYKHVRGAA